MEAAAAATADVYDPDPAADPPDRPGLPCIAPPVPFAERAAAFDVDAFKLGPMVS